MDDQGIDVSILALTSSPVRIRPLEGPVGMASPLLGA